MSKQRTRVGKSGGSRPAAPSGVNKAPGGKESDASQQRQVKAAQAAKRQQKREVRRQRPKKGRGHTGWAGMRRTRRQRLGIAAAALGAIVLIWIFADWQLAIGLTALVLVALPAVVVLTMGRRY